MTIKLYNTLTRQKETFQPIDRHHVKMYVCGPTVYNYIHIGNARPAIVFDTVRRYLEYRGYTVTYLLNFTDVDDKLINASKDQGEDVLDLADRFIEAYKQDVKKLGVKEATLHPRVSESMPDIIKFIEGLIDKGFAYESSGDVYFRTRRFENYGQLSHQSIDDLKSGARIEVGERKEDPLDFALWKEAKEDEIAWDSPWGKGRPGWHIECSAMVKKHLGETIDIHAGGQDLAFPHHENEIAQSEACTSQTFANYWMHNGYITVNDEKMSKSTGNFILANELLEAYSPALIRFYMLSVHYRSPINFSEELLAQAQNGLDRIQNAYLNLKHRKNQTENSDSPDDWTEQVARYKQSLIEAMDDDFNTANAISVLFDLSKEVNVYLDRQEVSQESLDKFIQLFDEAFSILGIELDEKDEPLLDVDVEQLIHDRNAARKNKDFNRADEIRDELKAQGIILEDTAQGTRWKRG
ncbi:cysteinyl-tRNA synthetase [Pelagirhabdus alkalitolerans]|uniref:Cysteine--tRNA ligase n=1 Tax=Pelagirhabdus alkalitolerans TaxID=1612202 RepID=A0A1G6MCX4_9BACI|nr:cysteine--tRNA ligase [Pelagirhabdus alkalitolerans]SDC52785.1 cysteinyl-tRNA synthetase [Pelagirhabdus alkalitolerans]